MNYIGWVIAIIVTFLLTYKSLKEEGGELDYVMDSMSFLVSWSSNQDYPIACNAEGVSKYEENAISVQEIQALVKKGLMACALDSRVGVPLGVGKALVEAAYIPIRASIPYELAKSALQQDESKRCSDYIKPLVLTCPALLNPYFERVQLIETED